MVFDVARRKLTEVFEAGRLQKLTEQEIKDVVAQVERRNYEFIRHNPFPDLKANLKKPNKQEKHGPK